MMRTLIAKAPMGRSDDGKAVYSSYHLYVDCGVKSYTEEVTFNAVPSNMGSAKGAA